jgi:hypothetical protein
MIQDEIIYQMDYDNKFQRYMYKRSCTSSMKVLQVAIRNRHHCKDLDIGY